MRYKIKIDTHESECGEFKTDMFSDTSYLRKHLYVYGLKDYKKVASDKQLARKKRFNIIIKGQVWYNGKYINAIITFKGCCIIVACEDLSAFRFREFVVKEVKHDG